MLKNRFFVQTIIAILFGIAGGTLYPSSALFIYILISIITLSSALLLFKRQNLSFKIIFVFILIIAFAAGYIYSSYRCNTQFSDDLSEENDSDKTYSFEGIITESNVRYTDVKVLSGHIKKGIKIRIYNLDYKDKNSPKEPFCKGNFTLSLSKCPDYIKADGISFYGKGFVSEIEPSRGYYVSKVAYKARTFLSD